MAFASRLGAFAAALIAGAGLAAAAPAQIFWIPPDFSGARVTGSEPGIAEPLPGATPAELDAALVWTLRAGLNVAALQCQFAPTLRTVSLYNNVIADHDKEFDQAQTALLGYFKRLAGKSASATKAAQNSFDQFTTRTYNSFSTLHAQYGFCDTAGKIGRAAIAAPKGELHNIAADHLREFRNSLVPAGDRLFAFSPPSPVALPEAALPDECFDRDGSVRIKKKKCRM